MTNQVLLYYKYVNVPDPEAERQAQLELGQRLDLKGRILIGSEGINGTVSGSLEAVNQYKAAMSQHQLFGGIDYKVDDCEAVPFPRLRVKVRPEIVTLGETVDMARSAPHVSPLEFNQLAADPNVVLFDARNAYESAIGKFHGAVTPNIELFKDLPQALESYQDLKDKTVVAYCTGGIRCEKVTALMKQTGWQNVYQLDGGIINYAQTYPEGAFEGECFVFDDRMSVGFKPDPEQLGACHFCADPTNRYINCAHKPCNNLILVCPNCSDRQTCSQACQWAEIKANNPLPTAHN